MEQVQNRRGLIVYITLIMTLILLSGSCSGSGAIDEQAFVIPERVRLRSSSAQAARYVSELKSGDRVTITGRTTSDEGLPWVRITGPNGETGWAETRYFVGKETVDKSREIADQIKNIQAQAIGVSKAKLRLRLSPERISDNNVAILLPTGTRMEITGRRRVPKPDLNISDSDDGSGNTSKPSASGFDDWLQVRLIDYSVLPAGWIYGGSVELEVPSDIVYFVSSGHRFTGWHKISTTYGQDGRSGDNFLVMEKKAPGGNETSDFDRIKVLAYEPYMRNYSIPYREDISGYLPITMKMNGTKGQFELIELKPDGGTRTLHYSIELSEGGKITIKKLGPKPG